MDGLVVDRLIIPVECPTPQPQLPSQFSNSPRWSAASSGVVIVVGSAPPSVVAVVAAMLLLLLLGCLPPLSNQDGVGMILREIGDGGISLDLDLDRSAVQGHTTAGSLDRLLAGVREGEIWVRVPSIDRLGRVCVCVCGHDEQEGAAAAASGNGHIRVYVEFQRRPPLDTQLQI